MGLFVVSLLKLLGRPSRSSLLFLKRLLDAFPVLPHAANLLGCDVVAAVAGFDKRVGQAGDILIDFRQ